MITKILEQSEKVAESGKYDRLRGCLNITFKSQKAKVKGKNHEACFALFEELGLEEELNALVTYHKELDSDTFDKEELRRMHLILSKENDKVLRDIVNDDIKGLTFQVGTSECKKLVEATGEFEVFNFHHLLIKE